jgi:recombination protein RecT
MSQEIRSTNGVGADNKPSTRTLRSFLEGDGAQAKLAEVASKFMQPADLVRLTLLAASRQPDLLKCSQTSILRALMDAATMGIMPGGTMGRGYLVPRKNKVTGTLEACFDPGYRGLIDIARRSGKVKAMDAKPVYQGDVFEYEEGLDKKLRHIPTLDAKIRGDIVAAYAIARFYEGDPQIEVLTRADIDKIRNSSASKSGPWATWYEEMARKSAVRRLCKLLPYDPVLERAIELATAAEVRSVQSSRLLDVSGVGGLGDLEAKLRDAKPQAGTTAAVIDVDVDMDPVPPTIDDSSEVAAEAKAPEGKPASVHDLEAQLRGHGREVTPPASPAATTPAVPPATTAPANDAPPPPAKERKARVAPAPQGAPRAAPQQATIGEFPGDPPAQAAATPPVQVAANPVAPPAAVQATPAPVATSTEDEERKLVNAWNLTNAVGCAVRVKDRRSGTETATTTAAEARIFGQRAIVEVNDGQGGRTMAMLCDVVPWAGV